MRKLSSAANQGLRTDQRARSPPRAFVPAMPTSTPAMSRYSRGLKATPFSLGTVTTWYLSTCCPVPAEPRTGSTRRSPGGTRGTGSLSGSGGGNQLSPRPPRSVDPVASPGGRTAPGFSPRHDPPSRTLEAPRAASTARGAHARDTLTPRPPQAQSPALTLRGCACGC